MPKELGTIGDVSYVEHGGGPVIEMDDGSTYVEYVEPPEEDFDEPGATWMVYRVELDAEIPDWIDMKSVASTVGRGWMEFASDFHSPDPMVRAFAYQDVASSWGWHELDNYPLDLGRFEVGQRYGDDLYPLMPPVVERQFVEGPTMGQVTVANAFQPNLATGQHTLDGAYKMGRPASEIHVYEEHSSSTPGHPGSPLGNYFVLWFQREFHAGKDAFVHLAYYEPDELEEDETTNETEPSEKLLLKGQKLEREIPDIKTVTPEEMLRRMSKWVRG